MSEPIDLTNEDVIQWINYYEEGNEIPDEIMVRILFMAQKYSEQTSINNKAV